MTEVEVSYDFAVFEIADDVNATLMNLFDAGLISGDRIMKVWFQDHIKQWCLDNLSYEVKLKYEKNSDQIDAVMAQFENDADATLFRLTWC